MCRAVKCAETIGELRRKLKKFLREEETTQDISKLYSFGT